MVTQWQHGRTEAVMRITRLLLARRDRRSRLTSSEAHRCCVSTGRPMDCSLDRVGRYSGGALFNGDYVEFMAWSQSLSDANCDSLYDNYFKFLYTTLP